LNLPLHGSNPKYLYDAYDLNIPEQIIDFSVNLNPYGPPAKLREIWNELYHDAIDYPDPYGQDLVSAIAQHHNLDENMVMIGNGAAELIFLLGQFFAERHVLVVEPAFSEYKKACEAFGCKVFSHVLYDQHDWNIDFVRIEEDVTGKDALFFCHPNNPTGKVYPKDHLLSLVEMAKEHACYVVIDEAFADFCSESTSIVKELQRYPNLIVLRSLTKMYAIAGLRLGYLLAHPEIISKLKQKQPHWSVNAIALKAGLICLKDDQHADRTRQMIDQERNRMIDALQNMGFRCSDSSVNFFLIHDPDIPSMDPLITFLLKKGLVVRHTKNFRGLDGRYIRVAVRKKEENDQLLSALREWKAK
jgi:threonine-phosphate decarboxylase